MTLRFDEAVFGGGFLDRKETVLRHAAPNSYTPVQNVSCTYTGCRVELALLTISTRKLYSETVHSLVYTVAHSLSA